MAKFYVVWKGRKAGIYSDWASCKAQVDGFAGAKYKSFKTQAEAQAAFSSGATASKATATKAVAKGASSGAKEKLTAATITALIADQPLAIFCDGACDPNPGPAGSGVAVYRFGKLTDCFYGIYHPQGSNNTAELLALHHALLLVEKEAKVDKAMIFSDSVYSINTVTQWAASWQAKGWRRAGNQPVKNLDIIKPLFDLYQRLASKVEIKHVAGHAGIEGNELADRMSVIAIQRQEGDLVAYQQPLVIDDILALKRG